MNRRALSRQRTAIRIIFSGKPFFDHIDIGPPPSSLSGRFASDKPFCDYIDVGPPRPLLQRTFTRDKPFLISASPTDNALPINVPRQLSRYRTPHEETPFFRLSLFKVVSAYKMACFCGFCKIHFISIKFINKQSVLTKQQVSHRVFVQFT